MLQLIGHSPVEWCGRQYEVHIQPQIRRMPEFCSCIPFNSSPSPRPTRYKSRIKLGYRWRYVTSLKMPRSASVISQRPPKEQQSIPEYAVTVRDWLIGWAIVLPAVQILSILAHISIFESSYMYYFGVWMVMYSPVRRSLSPCWNVVAVWC